MNQSQNDDDGTIEDPGLVAIQAMCARIEEILQGAHPSTVFNALLSTVLNAAACVQPEIRVALVAHLQELIRSVTAMGDLEGGQALEAAAVGAANMVVERRDGGIAPHPTLQ